MGLYGNLLNFDIIVPAKVESFPRGILGIDRETSIVPPVLCVVKSFKPRTPPKNSRTTLVHTCERKKQEYDFAEKVICPAPVNSDKHQVMKLQEFAQQWRTMWPRLSEKMLAVRSL